MTVQPKSNSLLRTRRVAELVGARADLGGAREKAMIDNDLRVLLVSNGSVGTFARVCS